MSWRIEALYAAHDRRYQLYEQPKTIHCQLSYLGHNADPAISTRLAMNEKKRGGMKGLEAGSHVKSNSKCRLFNKFALKQ